MDQEKQDILHFDVRSFLHAAKKDIVGTARRAEDDRVVFLFPNGWTCRATADFIASITGVLGAKLAWEMFRASLEANPYEEYQYRVKWPPAELKRLTAFDFLGPEGR